MSKKNPYTVPLRRRKDIENYLVHHEAYWPASSWNGGFVLSWNVKVYGLDWSGKSGDETVNPYYDAQWEAYCNKNSSDLFVNVCEDATYEVTHGGYSTFPGTDQGSYEFFLNGRSGGHLCLSKCEIVPQPYAWSSIPFSFRDRAHWWDYVTTLNFDDLRQLYRAIVCMDADFTREKAEAEVNYHLNRYRAEWERGIVKETLRACDIREGASI